MKERNILWVFLAFTLGFMLPVCTCVGSCFLSVASLGLLAEGGGPAATGPAVAVIRLNGAITSGSADAFSSAGITPDLVENQLVQAAGNPDVKAVVLRINSPGGSVVASNQIYHTLREFDKPIVVWMDETAASGGYYIACGTDYVIAHPDTLTGSIGVISQFINADDLLEEIGVDVVVITTGPRKDTGGLFRDMTDEERAYWQAIIDEVYDEFVDIVAEERGLAEETVRELADGSVYTGRQALELGLVDAVGLPQDAIAKAAELGGIEGKPRVIEIEAVPSFLEALYTYQDQSTPPTLEELLNWAATPSLEFRFARP
ncbi:MAG: signal peptide peptidase SppA [Anaerolineae bacterium]|nr:signal peptide peptidase SppA [Anaerolineae bacterium]